MLAFKENISESFTNSSGTTVPMVLYRFGFNGQEKDNEVYGAGNAYSAMFWEYDARLGRRWNLDPKPVIGISYYACFGLNPVLLSDPFGDKVKYQGNEYASKTKVFMKVLWARATNSNFRNMHRQMRRDDVQIFKYEMVGANNSKIPADSPSEVFPSGSSTSSFLEQLKNNKNVWVTEHKNIVTAITDQTKDIIHVQWREKNKETLRLTGASGGDLNSIDFAFNGPITKSTDNFYTKGTINVSGTLHEDTGQDIIIIRHGKNVIRKYDNLPVGMLRNFNINLPFNYENPAAISVTISNPNARNNSPGACYIKLTVTSE